MCNWVIGNCVLVEGYQVIQKLKVGTGWMLDSFYVLRSRSPFTVYQNEKWLICAMKIFMPIFVLLLLSSCSETQSEENEEKQLVVDTLSETVPVPVPIVDTCELERRLIAAGLVAIEMVDPTILVDLKYSRDDNFMKEDVYGDLTRLYLQPDVAKKLAKAQQLLKKHDSTLTLLVYDGVRPRSIQQMLWDKVDLPITEKGKFVSNPKNGSLHNYGAAVDITIARISGEAIDMGANYDDTAMAAYPANEARFLKEGILTQEHIDNRKLLRKVMQGAGFFGIQTEWWHFNSCTRAQAKEWYTIIE